MSHLLKLISLGIRHLPEIPSALERASMLDAASSAFAEEAPALAQKASVTAAAIRFAETAQGDLFESLQDR